MPRKVILCLFVLTGFRCYAQDIGADSSRYHLLRTLKTYIINEIRLTVGDHFYTDWSEHDGRLSYLYVSRIDALSPPDTISRFIYCGNDSAKAVELARMYVSKGLQVLHYRTAGTSAAKLNRVLWNYPVEAFVFTIFHEAVHVHLNQTRTKLVYAFEESLADAVANYYTPVFLKEYLNSAKAGLKQRRIHEKVYRLLINAENRFYKDRNNVQKNYTSTGKKLKRISSQGNAFQRDRYLYPVNNAFLMRNHDYCRNYFILFEKLKKNKDIIALIESLKRLKLESEIKTLE